MVNEISSYLAPFRMLPSPFDVSWSFWFQDPMSRWGCLYGVQNYICLLLYVYITQVFETFDCCLASNNYLYNVVLLPTVPLLVTTTKPHCSSLIVLQWRHNEGDGVSNRWCVDCLLSHLFRRRSKKTSKLRVSGICEGRPLICNEPNQIWFALGCSDNIRVCWRCINSLWPSKSTWRHRSKSTLAQVMDCCLMAASHNLEDWWLWTPANIS